MWYISDIYAPKVGIRREVVSMTRASIMKDYEITLSDELGNTKVVSAQDKFQALGVVNDGYFGYYHVIRRPLLSLLGITNGFELCTDFDTSKAVGLEKNYILYEGNRMVLVMRMDYKSLDEFNIFWSDGSDVKSILDLYLQIYSFNIDFSGYDVYFEAKDLIYKVDVNKKVSAFIGKYYTLRG